MDINIPPLNLTLSEEIQNSIDGLFIYFTIVLVSMLLANALKIVKLIKNSRCITHRGGSCSCNSPTDSETDSDV